MHACVVAVSHGDANARRRNGCLHRCTADMQSLQVAAPVAKEIDREQPVSQGYVRTYIPVVCCGACGQGDRYYDDSCLDEPVCWQSGSRAMAHPGTTATATTVPSTVPSQSASIGEPDRPFVSLPCSPHHAARSVVLVGHSVIVGSTIRVCLVGFLYQPG